MQDGRYAFRGRKHLLLPLLFLLPQLVITVVFFFYPAGEALMGSFYMEDSFGLSKEFVGLDNFTALFSDPSYLDTLRLTLVFSFATIVLTMGTALLFAVFAAFLLWVTRPDYRPLYTKLSPEDANRVVSMLQTEKISYRLEDNGATVLVPADSVYDMRIKIAGEGNLVGQGIGFEIFDTVQMGQTEFVQRINYQRALQGELSRTISEFPNVESARVHLVIPQRSLFIEEQQPPSASVVVRLREPSAKIAPREIKGMVNLMTMAVEGLDEGHVSITDSSGKAFRPWFPAYPAVFEADELLARQFPQHGPDKFFRPARQPGQPAFMRRSLAQSFQKPGQFPFLMLFGHDPELSPVWRNG